jgi:hypothetical protein
MITNSCHINFKNIREAYVEVKKFIELETGCDLDEISLKTKIREDLGCSGDDNLELLEKFVTRYNLDTTGFEYSKHFEGEMELYDSHAAFLNILILPIVIVVYAIKLLSFGKIDKRNWIPNWHRPTLDMTFGDMVTWYLTGKFNLKSAVKIKLDSA